MSMKVPNWYFTIIIKVFHHYCQTFTLKLTKYLKSVHVHQALPTILPYTFLFTRGGVLEDVFGLEASSPRKLACPQLEDSSIFWIVKILCSAWKIFWKTFFCGDRLKNFCEDLFFFFFSWRSPEKFLWRPFFFWRALALVSLVLGLGLEHSCPWPREVLSSERLSLALGSSLVSSTPPLLFTKQPNFKKASGTKVLNYGTKFQKALKPNNLLKALKYHTKIIYWMCTKVYYRNFNIQYKTLVLQFGWNSSLASWQRYVFD